jgi:hypothetical protein
MTLQSKNHPGTVEKIEDLLTDEQRQEQYKWAQETAAKRRRALEFAANHQMS